MRARKLPLLVLLLYTLASSSLHTLSFLLRFRFCKKLGIKKEKKLTWILASPATFYEQVRHNAVAGLSGRHYIRMKVIDAHSSVTVGRRETRRSRSRIRRKRRRRDEELCVHSRAKAAFFFLFCPRNAGTVLPLHSTIASPCAVRCSVNWSQCQCTASGCSCAVVEQRTLFSRRKRAGSKRNKISSYPLLYAVCCVHSTLLQLTTGTHSLSLSLSPFSARSIGNSERERELCAVYGSVAVLLLLNLSLLVPVRLVRGELASRTAQNITNLVELAVVSFVCKSSDPLT